MKPILILLPSQGFDPSEAAVPWQYLRDAGETLRFATPDGRPAAADPMMVSGEGLDWWGWIPGLKKLKLVGTTLRANADARRAYQAMIADSQFLRPLSYAAVRIEDYAGVLLPGGHAKSMRPYLESKQLQGLVAQCLAAGGSDHLPLAAVCHGVLVLARAQDDQGRSVIAKRRVTALTWELESKAWLVGRIFRFWDPHYYRTYLEKRSEPKGYWGTEQEITRALDNPEQFQNVPKTAADYRLKTDGMHRDSLTDARPAFVVCDGNLVTARWPGDIHLFAKTFLERIQAHRSQSLTATPSSTGAVA